MQQVYSWVNIQENEYAWRLDGTYRNVHTALFITAQMSMDSRMGRLSFIHTTKYYVAKEKNKLELW